MPTAHRNEQAARMTKHTKHGNGMGTVRSRSAANHGHPDGWSETADRLNEELSGRNIRAIARLEAAAQSERTPADRIVDGITVFCGSMSFVYVHALWFGFWVLWNVMPQVTKNMRFDPFPFQLLTLAVSLEAIFLSTFILISQNRQGHFAERRNHLDLQVNLLAEQESTKILSLLEAIALHLKVPSDDDPDLAELLQQTRPEHLVEEIEKIIEHHPITEKPKPI